MCSEIGHLWKVWGCFSFPYRFQALPKWLAYQSSKKRVRWSHWHIYPSLNASLSLTLIHTHTRAREHTHTHTHTHTHPFWVKRSGRWGTWRRGLKRVKVIPPHCLCAHPRSAQSWFSQFTSLTFFAFAFPSPITQRPPWVIASSCLVTWDSQVKVDGKWGWESWSKSRVL